MAFCLHINITKSLIKKKLRGENIKSFILNIISIITSINICLNAQINSPSDICGTDDRIFLGHKAVGRIWIGGQPATGWILYDGRIVTAAHVFVGVSSGFIEFNVPYSSDGSCDDIYHPSTENQYTIDFSSIEKPNNYSVGNDWAIFSVYPSANQTPIQRQNAFLYIEQVALPGDLIIYGYGKDETPEEFCYLLQKSTGEYLGLAGTVIKHSVDTEGGSSGSPIINSTTGKVIGIHTNGTCSSLGYNQGTSTFNTSFWTALNPYNFIVHQKRNSGSELTGTSISRWIGPQTSGAFQDYPVGADGALIEDVVYGNYETFKGKQDITSSSPYEKFNKWSNSSDIINFQKFLIEYPISEIISQFDLVQDGVVIKNEYPEIPLLNPSNDEIEFKDPWLVDYDDPNYNGSDKRNRGLSAIFKSRNAPFYPNISTLYGSDRYYGIFLDQEYDPQSNSATYYVRSPIQQSQDVYLAQTGKSHKFYFGNWSSTGTDPLIQNNILNGYYESPVVFRSGNAAVSANLKGTRLSNHTNAYSNSSQRRFIKTPDGVLHNCYESMNKVWYELSTDNGATWLLGNGGKPLSSADSKNPSMSIYGNQIGVVWQEQSGMGFKVRLAVFYGSSYSSPVFGTVADDPLPYSINANPVIAFGYSYPNEGNVMVAWSGGVYDILYEQRIMLRFGFASSNGIYWTNHSFLWQTDANSINPTIIADYTDNISNPFNYHLAWEQVINTSNSKVNYCRLYYQNNNIQQSTIEEASINSGYNKNYKPLITLRKAFGWEYIYLSWIGYRQFVSEGAGLEKIDFEQTSETRALVRNKLGANWSAIGVYGNSVTSQALNRGTTIISNQQIMGFAWSEYNGMSFVNKMMKFPVSQNIFTLNTTGKDLQVNNSVSFSDMFANSYQTVSSPFSFNLSQNFNSLNKENALMVYNGREGVVGRNAGQFYFALGDITVNGTNINFPRIPDSVTISTLAELNHYLTSEPFDVDNNASLVYGVQYGITDTLSCISALEDEREIKFRVELFDPLSNEIIGVFDNVTFNQTNVIQYENIGYQVDLTGIGNRSLKLRLVVEYNSDFSFNLSDRYADESLLAKNNLRTINYKGSLAVTEYALEQNYPNPFNPSTTIRYQLPQDGMVTLKVYDILGSEVTTLVNEQKSAGRYEVNFDASRLASGVYIYKLQAGDYIQSKKMLLVK